MLQDIPNLGSSDPKVSKAAALNIIQHVSKNKGELEYLVKRLVNGLESGKISTRTGCYSTLSALLGLRRVNPFQLFDLMQKALITNKQSSKKERRLIYIARILCTGAIFKTNQVVELSKDVDFLAAALKDIVDLSKKKSSYFKLATPFLSHILQDNTLTQETFDNLVWPMLLPLYSQKLATESEDAQEDPEEEDSELEDFCCKVQLALICKNGEYKLDFDCLKDITKITKAFLNCRIQFPDEFIKSILKHMKDTSEVDLFITQVLEQIKPTQFDILCLCVEKSVEEDIPASTIVSKRLITFLLSVFRDKENTEFHEKSKKAIKALLTWKEDSMGKKQRKATLKILFGEDPPNILHEYKHLFGVVRTFLTSVKPRDLETLSEVVTAQLRHPDVGLRMAITYIQFLAKIAQLRNTRTNTVFEIGKLLLNIALGKDKIVVKIKKEEVEEGEEKADSDSEMNEDDGEEQIKKCGLDALKGILVASYDHEFMTLMSSYLIESSKELTDNVETLRTLKSIKKAQKKFENEHLKYILWAYGLRVLLDEEEVLCTSGETVNALVEIARNTEGEEEMFSELIKFILSTVLKEPHPAFNVEGMFLKLIMEGKVKEDAVQLLADAIDVQLSPEDEEEDSDMDEEEDENEQEKPEGSDDSEEGDDDETIQPPRKKAKGLDPAIIAKLKDTVGDKSDSEESIDMDDATEDDLKKMDGALSKVFAIKKNMKEEQRGEIRSLMRTFRLVDIYISRHIKAMPVSSLLMLTMPVVHSLQNSLKLKKNTELTTKVIGNLDNLNRCKKFVGCDDVVEGTLATMATELYAMAIEKKNKLIRELLEHSVILITKCFLQKSKKSKKEEKRFVEMYLSAVDTAKSKIRKRKVIKKENGNKFSTSRFVRLALDVLTEWKKGKNAINERMDCEN